MAMTVGERMGWLRAGIGVAMILAPGVILRVSDRERVTATSSLLLRTIGIRDLALGMGVVAAARSDRCDELRRWTSMALVSDSLDVTASVLAGRSIGRRDAGAAAGLAVLAVLGDTQVLRGLRARTVAPAPSRDS
jgi:hypothetical protein